MIFYLVKEVHNKRWSKIIEAAIQNDAQPLYIVRPAYFPENESAQLSEVVDQSEGIAFVGSADQEDQGVEAQKG